MTLDDWLGREPAPPPQLAARIRSVMRSATADTPEVSSAALLERAEGLLERLLPAGCGDRGNAVDLLVADALVTYAFERAADAPERLEAQATAAMARLGSFAEGR